MLVGSILSPLVFCCRHFSAADCKLISCRAAWLGVLVPDFFHADPTQFESSLNKKQLRTGLFLLSRSRIRRQSTPWKLYNSKLSNVYTPPHQPQPTSPTQPPNISPTNPLESSLIPASARQSPPSPSPRYRPHAESSHHEVVRRCTA